MFSLQPPRHIPTLPDRYSFVVACDLRKGHIKRHTPRSGRAEISVNVRAKDRTLRRTGQ
jgi:hypothetical protein